MLDSSGNVVTPEDQQIIEEFAQFLQARREYRETLTRLGAKAAETIAARERLRKLIMKSMEEPGGEECRS